MNIENRVKDNFNNFIDDLSKIIAIPSISTAKKPPYDEECSKCLDTMLEICEREGFKTKNINGIVGYADWGEGDKYIASVAHLDVVPAQDGWDTDPFKLTRVEDKYIARGVIDDKGPALMMLYACKMLKDIKPKTKFRMIFGTNEECGSHELPAYLAEEPAPEFCFTPDSEYPLTYAEKGIVNYKVNIPFDESVEVLGDMNRNRVPEDITIKYKDKTYHAKGKGAHAAWPFHGDNALVKACGMIDDDFFQAIYCAFNESHEGKKIGLGEFDMSPDPKQTFVCTPYKMGYVPGTISVYISVRYPTFITQDQITGKIFSRIPEATYEIKRAIPPSFTDVNNPYVKKLLAAYRSVTGDMSDPVNSTGGTYAKHFPNTVAFGAAFQNRAHISKVAHNANEYMYVEDIYKNLEIYTHAIYNLVL